MVANTTENLLFLLCGHIHIIDVLMVLTQLHKDHLRKIHLRTKITCNNIQPFFLKFGRSGFPFKTHTMRFMQ